MKKEYEILIKVKPDKNISITVSTETTVEEIFRILDIAKSAVLSVAKIGGKPNKGDNNNEITE